MNIKEEIVKIEDEDDFGFSLITKDDIKETNTRVQNLKKLIMPLLNNLLKDEDKEYLFWPDRVKKVKEFITKIEKI